MPKCGQMRVGAAWVGSKEPDLIAPNQLRFYDRRCRARCILGAMVRGSIAKSSTWQIYPGTGYYGTKKGQIYQKRWRYFRNIGKPGSDLENWQAIFKTIMAEVKVLTEGQRAPYKVMAAEYVEKNIHHPGTYRARDWSNFYIAERLKQLYPGYP